MCGLTGFLSRVMTDDRLENVCRAMTNTLTHRGPDALGVWIDVRNRFALGHRRLSIIDLSEHGHQPMESPDRKFVVALNGEIYNYQQIARTLKKIGYKLKGSSDTEVVVCAIQEWGIERSLKTFTGMFSIAVWDKRGKLFLARDRLGEKPLYYGKFGNAFGFASELKALAVHPDWEGGLNTDSIALQLKYGYVPEPHSIYRGIFKLPPGTFLEAKIDGDFCIGDPKPYWSFSDLVAAGSDRRQRVGNSEEVSQNLHQLLRETISDKMISDVPLGAFLSGGMDSSLIVALMQEQSTQPVKTFCIGFSEEEYNEAHYARRVADEIGSDHTELFISSQDCLKVIPNLPDIYDEPFADPSQIPTFLVSKLAREHVTVSLSGDGGDELFGGYPRYVSGQDAYQRAQPIPPWLLQFGGRILKKIPASFFGGVLRPIKQLLPSYLQKDNIGSVVNRAIMGWDPENKDHIYDNFICMWRDPHTVFKASSLDFLGEHRKQSEDLSDFTERMMFMDTVTYLPGDILAKVDRAGMATSLETRIPFLDHRVVEFAWNQPRLQKVSGNRTKIPLRHILENYLSKDLIERPKMGFGVPIDQWLKGPLKQWASDLLSEDRLKQQGILDSAKIQAVWQDHLSGEISGQYMLWPVLMFQAWHDRWMGK